MHGQTELNGGMQCPACSEPLGCGNPECAPCLLGMEANLFCQQIQQQQQQAGVQLPDEVWLGVFALLDARTLLLAVRPTCRRWSALALDPSVWEGKELDMSTPLPLLLAVCRMAPCVRLLRVSMSGLSWSALTQLAGTSCAASVLSLYNCTLHSMVWAAKILQNQLARDSISSLELEVELGGSDAHLQLAQLLTGTERLGGIKLIITDRVDGEGAAPSSALPHTASLPISNLQYTGAKPVPLLRWLLAASSNSLKCLVLLGAVQFHSAPPLAELAECRQVNKAYMPFGAIQAIPPGSWGELKDLALQCYAPAAYDTLRQASIEFIRSAPQLENLGFYAYSNDAAEISQELTVLPVAALASLTEQAQTPSIRVLTLWFDFGSDVWNALAVALPGLPALRQLDLGLIPPPSFTEAISPRSTPRLALLQLFTWEPNLLTQPACAHLHELVLRYPAVHVLVEYFQGSNISYTALCGHLVQQDCDRSALDDVCNNYTLVRVVTRSAAST